MAFIYNDLVSKSLINSAVVELDSFHKLSLVVVIYFESFDVRDATLICAHYVHLHFSHQVIWALNIALDVDLGQIILCKSSLVELLGQIKKDFLWLSLFSAHLLDVLIQLLNS